MYSRKARDMHTPALSLTYCESFSLRNYLSMDKVARPMYLEAYDPRLSSPGPPSFQVRPLSTFYSPLPTAAGVGGRTPQRLKRMNQSCTRFSTKTWGNAGAV